MSSPKRPEAAPVPGGASPEEIAALIANRVEALPKGGGRRLIAVAGAPASGKSTVAAALVAELAHRGEGAGLMAMDGFHLDNAVLEARGLMGRKGAPETFDLTGFAAMLERLAAGGEVIVPVFDRSRDVSVGSANVIAADATSVVVEGNYLLLDEPGWRDLRRFWAFAVEIAPPLDVIEARLLQRWRDHGLAPEAAQQKVRDNDLPNARRILAHRLAPDMRVAG